jgi:hypothetical protein
MTAPNHNSRVKEKKALRRAPGGFLFIGKGRPGKG